MATRLRSASHTVSQSRLLESLQDRRPDPEPVRLVTRLHLPAGAPRTAAWRVMAELMDGHRRMVCLGVMASDARRLARQAERAGELPPHTMALRLQRWAACGNSGHWEDFE